MSNKLEKEQVQKEKKQFIQLNKNQITVLALMLLVFMPYISFYMFETIAGNYRTIMESGVRMVLLNLCVWYLLYMIFFVLSNHVKYTILILNTVTYIFAVANAFVVQFRGQPIMVMDIKSIGTAMSVAGEYTYAFTGEMVWMGILMLCINLVIIVLKIDFFMPNWKIRIGYTVLVTICTVYALDGMLVGDWFAKAGSKGLDFFKVNLTYQTQGYMACTMHSLRYLQIDEPEGYSADTVKTIAQNIKVENQSEEDLPENVIVIMNESFADLSVLGEFRTSEPVLAYFDSLSGDNVKKGNLYVSVFGGATANTEYEFLTGNSMAFLPHSAVSYQIYVNEGDSSIVSCFKEKGYHTIAFHPFRKENYNRHQVYDIYGFDEYYGLDDVEVKKVRGYTTDKSDYKNIIKMYEEKEPGEKLFIFNVTMQNHSGYDSKKFKDAVTLTDYPGRFPQAEQYLGLIKKSDSALEYLLDYFSKLDEKTVILFFGDHQPNLEDGFQEFLLGEETPENVFSRLEKKMMTRYMLWANYPLDIEEEKNLSANYLGSYLLDAIGMEMPVYNRYLLDSQEKMPAVNVYGFADETGTMHWLEEDCEYQEILSEYEMFQYNNLFDNKNRLTELYE